MEGSSCLQGPHHVAQKLRSTTFPLKELRLVRDPSSAVRVKSSGSMAFDGTWNPDFMRRLASSAGSGLPVPTADEAPCAAALKETTAMRTHTTTNLVRIPLTS
jgi:hypothetical protein